MNCRTSDSKACNTNNVSIGKGVANLISRNERERDDHLAAKRAALRDGCDPMQDESVLSSGSRGIGPRTFQRWDAKERRYRKWYFDAIAERWVEQDTRPRWQQDLDAVRARLAAKGKLPLGA